MTVFSVKFQDVTAFESGGERPIPILCSLCPSLSDFFGERAFAFERKIAQQQLYSKQKNVTVHGKTYLNAYPLNG